MKGEIKSILVHDSICFRESPTSQDEYHEKLAKVQQETTDPLFEFMKTKFDINLKIFYDIPLEE